MGKSEALVYWDSVVFLAYLLPEEERIESCKRVLQAAEEGTCVIVTSAITLTEVIKLKKHPPIGQDQEEKIRKFFLRKYIRVRGVDRILAEEARQLIWKHGVAPKDALHVATALQDLELGAPLEELHTYDQKLLKLSGSIGDPPLEICEPRVPAAADPDQGRLPLGRP